MQPLDLLNANLREISKERNRPAPRPRPAASLIVVDRSTNTPSVLMGRRNRGLAFMGGYFVFPGGRVERSDARAPRTGALLSAVNGGAAQMNRPAELLALAAIRETFEETGYLIGTRSRLGRSAPSGGWSRFAAQCVTPSLDGIGLVARAITPPGPPRRFDAAFFFVDSSRIAGRAEPLIDENSELTEIVWTPLSDIDRLPLHAVTRVVLHELRLRLSAPDMVGLPVYRMTHGVWRRDVL